MVMLLGVVCKSFTQHKKGGDPPFAALPYILSITLEAGAHLNLMLEPIETAA